MRKLIILFITFWLFGCIVIQKDLGAYVKREKLKITPEEVPINYPYCQALVCKNSTELGWIGSVYEFLGLYKEKYFIDKCWIGRFDPFKDVEIEELKDMMALGSSKGYVKEFMYGIGPSLSAGDEAQRFCSSLGFVIHDLGGDYIKNQDPSTINENLLIYYLKSEIIPILLYQPRKYNEDFSRLLAKNISRIDRTVILAIRDYTTQFNSLFNELNYRNIKDNCPKCLTAAYIKINETEQLEKHKNFKIAAGKTTLDFIDIVMYEVNMNDYSCNQYNFLNDIMEFSERINKEYSKPSIIILKVEEDGNCTEEKIARSFDYILSYIPFLSLTGAIGIGYEDLAFFFKDDGSPKSLVFNSWFANCREYYSAQTAEKFKKVYAIHALGAPLASPCPTFSGESAALFVKCEYINISNIEPIDLESINEPILFDIPSPINGDLSELSKENVRTIQGYEKICERWSSQIREFTSHYQFDYSFVRAVVWKENKFVSHTEYNRIPPLDSFEKIDPYCERYDKESVNYKICNGVERLKYYWREGERIKDDLKRTGYPTEDWFLYYISYYGYKYGNSSLYDNIEGYKRCINEERQKEQQAKQNEQKYTANIDKCKRLYFGDENIKKIGSDTKKIRELCFENRFINSSKERPPWGDVQYTKNLRPPFKRLECIVDFNKPLGTFWNSGLILRDKKGDKDVFAAEGGSVIEVGESPRLGKYVIIKNGGFYFRYSGLSTINVKKNQNVNRGDKIGETTQFLRFEISDSDPKKVFAIPTFYNPKYILGIRECRE